MMMPSYRCGNFHILIRLATASSRGAWDMLLETIRVSITFLFESIEVSTEIVSLVVELERSSFW